MNRSSRSLTSGAVVLSSILLAYACGDGGTEPAPPPQQPSRPTSVTVNPATARFAALGDTERLSAQVRDQNGQPIAGATLAWTSSDPSVASVDGEGVVTSAGNGSATITATAGSASGTAAVTVAQEVGGVVVSPDIEFLAEGDTARLSAEAADANGHPVAGATLSWSSSDPALVEVDDSGLVRGVALGTATITATAEGVGGTSRVSVVGPERGILAAFYDATNGEGWIEDEGWLTDRPIGEWHGVTTGEDGRVTELRLPASNLIGSIPPELAHLPALEVVDFHRNLLAGPIPPELGYLPELKSLILGVNRLTGRIPPELGNLSNLEVLRLRRNAFTDGVPPELGNLRNLTKLRLQRNRLTGTVPQTFLELERLDAFHFVGNESLCVAESAGFREWLGRIEVYSGPICNESDREVLAGLYESTGGANWTNSDGWLGDDPLDDWHGVQTDSLGQVAGVDLSDNGLTGRIGSSLAALTSLVSLRLDGNTALSGSLPASLTVLSLQEFHYQDTGLCVPADSSFADWLGSIASHQGTNMECPPLSDREVLTLLYHETSGSDWVVDTNWLTDRPLGQWHGVETDSEGRVTSLTLRRNILTGQIPAELSSLSALETLDLSSNHLWGAIQRTLGDLSGLTKLLLLNNRFSGPIPIELGNASALAELNLDYNLLSGPIPAELGKLSGLQILSLRSNSLTGPIPAELGKLSGLQILSLRSNSLTGPVIPELGNLSALNQLDLARNRLTGPIPAELGKLTRLGRLSLSSNDLTGPITPELAALPALTHLFLGYNSLTGPIPVELGNMRNLAYLSLDGNHLTGAIPPALGNLSSLESLTLSWNRLTGAIPPALGNLSNLESLTLSWNQLTGAIPPALGNLAALSALRIGINALSGPIPAELGNLSNLELLDVSWNSLTGPIPSELGSLADLRSLLATDNQFTGTIPPEFGEIAALEQLYLFNNAGMSGPLPPALTELTELGELLLGGTSLCAPEDADFQDWLGGLTISRVQRCGTEGGSRAYMTQGVQSLPYPVPLVASDPALLRVFVTASSATTAGIPPVRATFYIDGAQTHAVDIPGSNTAIPTTIDAAESELGKSANVEIPGWVVQEGLEMVIDIDPQNTLDPGLGVTKRIPETGRSPVRVESMPTLDLTFVPFQWALGTDSSIVEFAEGMAADPHGHEMLWDTRTALPVGDLDVTAHEPVLTSTTDVFTLVRETLLIRAMESGTGYYMGIMPEDVVGGQSGIASLGGRVGFSIADGFVIAHELGHNMSLRHAPCGTNGDPAFPYSDGSIGVWGYDFRDGGTLVSPRARDMMSYCGPPRWVSDFSFGKALHYRLRAERTVDAIAGPPSARPAQTILLWGGVDAQGQPHLEPAFVADASPALPDSPGEYELTGHAANGAELFSLSFDMPEIADGDGSSSFVFALLVRPEWAGALEDITLSGPAGSVTIDQTTDQPMAILRDFETGQVRAILRDIDSGPVQAILGDPSLTGAAPSLIGAARQSGLAGLPWGSRLEVLRSRGVPDAGQWARR